jgi:peptidylprolyl isomerase
MPQFSLPNVLGLATVVALVGAGLGTAVVVAVNSPEECLSPLAAGSASNLVQVTPTLEGLPDASFPTPLLTEGTQLTVLAEGSGNPARAGDFIDFDVSVFVGSDQALLTASSYDSGNPVRRPVGGEVPEFFGGVLECQKPGATIVVTSTVAEVFGPIQEDDYLQADSTLAVVVNVRNTYEALATGDPRLPQSGLPTLVQAPTGEHGLTFPNAPIPDDLRISVLKQGEGEAIAEGNFVTATFTGFVWNTRSVFISSFDQGVPLSLVASDITTSTTGQGVIPGIAEALIGQTVGSQVLVSIPPALGYAQESLPPGVPPGATLVYVFDIVGVNN